MRMNVKIVIGKEWVFVKELTQHLENFTIHDFLPHGIITRIHARHIDMHFEGYISTVDVVDLSGPHYATIEHPEGDSAGKVMYRHFGGVFIQFC